MTKEGSAKTVNFISSAARGLMLGRGYICLYCDYALFYTLSIALVAIVLREYNAAFLCHCWFLFILWLASWYANMSSSDNTQVTV